MKGKITLSVSAFIIKMNIWRKHLEAAWIKNIHIWAAMTQVQQLAKQNYLEWRYQGSSKGLTLGDDYRRVLSSKSDSLGSKSRKRKIIGIGKTTYLKKKIACKIHRLRCACLPRFHSCVLLSSEPSRASRFKTRYCSFSFTIVFLSLI